MIINFKGLRFSMVFAAIILYWAAAPLMENFISLKVLTGLFFTAILLSTVVAVSQVRSHAVIATVLALPMILGLGLQFVTPKVTLDLVGSIFQSLFFGYTAFLILAFLLRETKVTLELIFAALVAYLFFGMFWAGIFSTLELLQPGSFSVPGEFAGPTSRQFGYFSIVTLTTLGYGDITPLSASARAFATLEALLGQVYLTVLVARLVGIYSSRDPGQKG